MLFLLILLFIGMTLEMFGLGIILPVLAVILDENTINNYPILTSWLNNLGLKSYKEISVFLVSILAFVYLIKTIFLVVVTFFRISLFK